MTQTIKVKRSRQREAILEVLNSTKAHPTAERVYEEAKLIIPNISLGTVYRNLSKLVGAGEILKVDVGDGYDHFDGNSAPHYHLVCEKCAKVFDLDIKYDNTLNNIAQNKVKGKINSHSLLFYGTCDECAK
ncbi:MAG: transcriptional repressor [Oscillospiraceae bacterium]